MGHGCHDCGVPNGCECCRQCGEPPHKCTCSAIARPRTRTAEMAQKADDALAAEVAVLLQKARELPPPTERHRQEQALSFTYGNLALSSNHKPSYQAFLRLAIDRYGWTPGEFQIFAASREWAK